MSSKKELDNISKRVAQCIELDREIQEKEAMLKGMKAELAALAVEEPESMRVPTEGGGYSVVYDGPDGSIARVTQPGERLKTSIDVTTPAGSKLKEKAGKAFDRLFRPVLKYAPVEGFREVLGSEFSLREANAILKLASTKSATTVSFETKEVA